MVTSEIKITSIFPPTLDTREGASRLIEIAKEEITDDNRLVLDFQGVVFMSRSFADQFHKELNACESKVDLVIKNAEYGIIEMLDAVAKTQNSRKKIKRSYRVLSFNDLVQLKDYSYIW